MQVLLIRHAVTSGQAPDATLSPEGYAQAEALVPVLTQLNVGALYSSPYTRAQETIAPYASSVGQTITTLDGMKERTLSPVKLPDWKDHIERSFVDVTYAPAGGESHADLVARATVDLRRVEQEAQGLPAIVSHGGMLSALFQSHDPSFGVVGWKTLRNPDLWSVTLRDGRIKGFYRMNME